MQHTIRTTPEGYLYCTGQARGECLLVRFAREVAAQLTANHLISHPATPPVGSAGAKI